MTFFFFFLILALASTKRSPTRPAYGIDVFGRETAATVPVSSTLTVVDESDVCGSDGRARPRRERTRAAAGRWLCVARVVLDGEPRTARSDVARDRPDARPVGGGLPTGSQPYRGSETSLSRAARPADRSRRDVRPRTRRAATGPRSAYTAGPVTRV